MTTAATLDLSRLDPPTLFPLDFEAEREAFLAEYARLWAIERQRDPTLPVFDVERIKADPVVQVARASAWHVMRALAAANDHAAALRLASAVGADLDHIAGSYHRTSRLVLDPGDLAATPPRERLLESDEEYRLRAQLAPEATPEFVLTPGGYIARVRRVFGDRIKGVRAIRGSGGEVAVVVLGRSGNGAVEAGLVAEIQAAYAGEADSGASDIPVVRSAAIVSGAFTLTVGIRRGPDPAPVIAAGVAAIERLAAERHQIGETLHVAAIEAAATVGPVRWARAAPGSVDLVGGIDGAPFLTSITILPEVEP